MVICTLSTYPLSNINRPSTTIPQTIKGHIHTSRTSF